MKRNKYKILNIFKFLKKWDQTIGFRGRGRGMTGFTHLLSYRDLIAVSSRFDLKIAELRQNI